MISNDGLRYLYIFIYFSITFHIEDFVVCLSEIKYKSVSGVANVAKIEFDESVLEILTKLVGKSGKALLRVNEYATATRVVSSPVVYEVIIQNISSGHLVLELNKECFSLIQTSAIPVNIDVCFCLIDVFQSMHSAIENVNLDIIFPDVSCSTNLPNSSSKPPPSERLSVEQSHAIDVMLDSSHKAPVLLLGPFGAGKTRTIAASVNRIIARRQPESKILICTHSNSAADHYIEEYFHPKHKKADLDPRTVPLRINWEHRYTTSVSDKVLTYCLQDLNTGLFATPVKEDLDKHTIIICTLITSESLYKLGLPAGYFSHIFIDEAAQAMEVEALVPLQLATRNTRVVLAGDHLQV